MDEVLIRAAEIIDEDGFYQARHGKGEGGTVCLVIAVQRALCEKHYYLGAALAPSGSHLDSHLDRLCKHLHINASSHQLRVADLVKWNDAKDRTAEEVMKLLREVAEAE